MILESITFLGIVGLFGVGLYIGIYILLRLEILRGGSFPHSLLSLIGASCVLLSLTENFNLSSAIIQSTWIVISILGLGRLYFINKTTKFDRLELIFLKTKLPRLTNAHAKRLFGMGEWKSGRRGEVLVSQDQQVEKFCYLAEGQADVFIDGELSATSKKGDFIGEITYLSGEPATGTVVLSEPSTYFCIDVMAMRKLAKFNNTLHYEIEKSIADDLRGKLARTSRKPKKINVPVEDVSSTLRSIA